MDEEISIIDSNTRNEKLKNFFIDNRKNLTVITIITIISLLVYVSFNLEEILLPRQSRYMANVGTEITLDKAQKGDLLFFITGRKSKKINHVGLVVSKEDEEVNFIHSTNGRGVIISSLSDKYWKKAFLKATRVL